MAELEITTMSSKGQIVIPQEMRKDFHEGEKFVIIKVGKQLILRSAAEFDKNIKEFAQRTEEAWQRYEKGEFVGPFTVEEFRKRMRSW